MTAPDDAGPRGDGAWGFFIRRPVATTLMMVAIALPGLAALTLLPIASLPQVDFPVVGVTATLPGASAETMAATVATPLERSLGRIGGLNDMTSSSAQGTTRINLQFDLGRDVDAAAREVQAALHAARPMLPSGMPGPPTYRKANSGGSGPVLAIALTSPTRSQEQMYDLAFTVIAQKISQIRGVGSVGVNGSALRAVRVEVRPDDLNHVGVGLEDVRLAIARANPRQPKGFVEQGGLRWQIEVNDKGLQAGDFRDLVIAWRDDAPVRLSDVATVRDAVQDLRNAGTSAGRPAVMLAVTPEPGANVVRTVDDVKALLPRLKDLIPADVDVEIVIDRSTTIRKSLRETGETLAIAIALVVLVARVFLGSGRSALIPTIAIPVSLLGTLALIHLLGYSLNNLVLMALIIATGFVVDDAIVVLESIAGHVERGLAPVAAAVRGVREVGFTVLAMSLSLITVFIPLLWMDGFVGRLFKEFAVTLSLAVAISLLVSVTAIPMLCARWLRRAPAPRSGREAGALAGLGRRAMRLYARTLDWSLRHRAAMVLTLATMVASTFWLYAAIPKGLFPQQDTGRLSGFFRGDQSISFQAMRHRIDQLMRIVGADPDIDTFYEYTGAAGSGRSNAGNMYARLKPLDERSATAAEVVARLRPRLATVPGAALFLTAQQDINIGSRSGSAEYQYTLLAEDLDALRTTAPRLQSALARQPQLTDVGSDFEDRGLSLRLIVDRDAAARLGISAHDVDTTLNDAFGPRLASTLYEPLNQYHVVLGLDPRWTRGPEALAQLRVRTDSGRQVPLSAFSRWAETNQPLVVNHQGTSIAATVSFNLAPGVSLEHGTRAVEEAFAALHPPDTVRGVFSGTAQVFRDSLRNQPLLILAAVVALYIVLGMLYESAIHPLTILSTLPSAGVGALLALRLSGSEFSIIASIGILLLVGIVMKNAIMMVDCALRIEREDGLAPAQAIARAAMLRARPIVMTTVAAILGALPLAVGAGDGAELRRPLGIAIVGGLLLSQLLTLYTTPAVYLCMDGARHRLRRRWHAWFPAVPARP